MSEQGGSPAVRSGSVVMAVVVAASAIVWIWVVAAKVADGTVFWPSVFASFISILAVGIGSWVMQRRRRALEQTDPEAADRFRRQTLRWALVMGAAGLLLIGLTLAWLLL